MKWKFLVLACIAAAQGGLLTWNEWMMWRDYELMRAQSIIMTDGGVEGTIYCGRGYFSGWPPLAVIILSFLSFFYCLRQFFILNADVPIKRRKLRILTRP